MVLQTHPTTGSYGLVLERRPGSEGGAIMVKSVDEGSPNQGSLQRGDELLMIGGVGVQADYAAVIAALTANKGRPVACMVARHLPPRGIAPATAATNGRLSSAGSGADVCDNSVEAAVASSNGGTPLAPELVFDHVQRVEE